MLLGAFKIGGFKTDDSMKKYFLNIDRVHAGQLVRYGAVGVLTNGLGYALFLLILWVGGGHKFAASFTYMMGVVFSFWLNRALVFNSNLSVWVGTIRLGAMILVGYLINISILYGGTDLMGISPWFTQMAAIVIVSVFFYLANKFYVHRGAAV